MIIASIAQVNLFSGTASAEFQLNFKNKNEYYHFVVGVFPADLELDGDISSADGKRCAMVVGAAFGGHSFVVCDGDEPGGMVQGLGWQPGDTVRVDVTFADGNNARVTLTGKTEPCVFTLRDVPACGLRFGVGLCTEGHGATLVALHIPPPDGASLAGRQSALS